MIISGYEVEMSDYKWLWGGYRLFRVVMSGYEWLLVVLMVMSGYECV